MEIIESNPFEKKVTIKDHYKSLVGVPVNLDYFFYAALEEELTFRALKKEITDFKRYPKTLVNELPAVFDDACESLMAWYCKEFPVLCDSQVIDRGLVGEISGPFVALIEDIKVLMMKYKDALGIQEPSKFVAVPSLWSKIQALFASKIGAHGEMMIAFLKWRYSPPEQVQLSLGDLPPVGRFFSVLMSYQRKKFAEANSREDVKNFSRKDLPRDRVRPESRGDERGSSRETSARGPKFDNSASGDRDSRGSRPSRPSRHSGGRGERDIKGGDEQKQAERTALQEVEVAIAVLRADNALSEIILKPQNSFLRRIQHSKVHHLGFQSESVGEQKDRSLKITRK